MAAGARPETGRPGSGPGGTGARAGADGVEANARLTSSTAVVLFVLLAVEGVTVLSARSLLTAHVFVGMLLIPPVLLKIGSTVYRFARYYQGHPAYRDKGPPPWLLRILGPAVVVLTLVMFGTGVGLMFVGTAGRDLLLTAHKASFVLWFLAMTVHVLGHLADIVRLGRLDWVGRSGRVAGSG
ncbi:MAG TPA: hypothetical protein VFW24_07730, partial [Acidimicrobiales bacterium]|nr:hypothetical protein [Acidimicrobiales bacterium]